VAIRLVLAEDSYLVREGIRRLLETQPGLELVASCGDLESLLRAVEAEAPDVVLTDIRDPNTLGWAQRNLERPVIDHWWQTRAAGRWLGYGKGEVLHA
jgi:DNA-binding NarL/FixJ family response regulator